MDSGAMPMKHIPFGLEEAHVQAWLDLWSRPLPDSGGPSRSDRLIDLAETIGQRLRQIVAFHAPSE
jgi:truncated hemoglobin YjbI